MERLTIPDEKIEGGVKRTVIDARKVKEHAMTIYWALKKYEDTGLTPEEIRKLKERDNDSWISVEERMPEVGKKVLCYFSYDHDFPDVICDNRYIGSGMWESESDNVVAWMPRPDEYHPKRENKAWKENFLRKFNKRT